MIITNPRAKKKKLKRKEKEKGCYSSSRRFELYSTLAKSKRVRHFEIPIVLELAAPYPLLYSKLFAVCLPTILPFFSAQSLFQKCLVS
jgi:hypothetical protein